MRPPRRRLAAWPGALSSRPRGHRQSWRRQRGPTAPGRGRRSRRTFTRGPRLGCRSAPSSGGKPHAPVPPWWSPGAPCRGGTRGAAPSWPRSAPRMTTGRQCRWTTRGRQDRGAAGESPRGGGRRSRASPPRRHGNPPFCRRAGPHDPPHGACACWRPTVSPLAYALSSVVSDRERTKTGSEQGGRSVGRAWAWSGIRPSLTNSSRKRGSRAWAGSGCGAKTPPMSSPPSPCRPPCGWSPRPGRGCWTRRARMPRHGWPRRKPRWTACGR